LLGMAVDGSRGLVCTIYTINLVILHQGQRRAYVIQLGITEYAG